MVASQSGRVELCKDQSTARTSSASDCEVWNRILCNSCVSAVESHGIGLKTKMSAPASRNSASLSFADSPQIRHSTPFNLSALTVSVPSICFSTEAIYISMNIRSKCWFSVSRMAVSPFAASRMFQPGATVRIVREKSFRSIGSSSTNSTSSFCGSWVRGASSNRRAVSLVSTVSVVSAVTLL